MSYVAQSSGNRQSHSLRLFYYLSIQLKWLLVICIAFYRISAGLNRKYEYHIISAISKSPPKRKTLARPNAHTSIEFQSNPILHSFRIWRANRFHLLHTRSHIRPNMLSWAALKYVVAYTCVAQLGSIFMFEISMHLINIFATSSANFANHLYISINVCAIAPIAGQMKDKP